MLHIWHALTSLRPCICPEPCHHASLLRLAVEDMVESKFAMKNSGQGQVRTTKSSKRVRSAFEAVVSKIKDGARPKFVGSDVIHMCDAAVPNGIVAVLKLFALRDILNAVKDALLLSHTREMISAGPGGQEALAFARCGYRTLGELQDAIIDDLIRTGFDGRGGDSPQFAGDCIDGRLTSISHWYGEIGSKQYGPAFHLSAAVKKLTWAVDGPKAGINLPKLELK